MAFVFDEAWINNGQLVVASDTVKPPGQGLGKGADRVRHSAYIEGPLQVGQTGDFTTQQGTVMIGKDGNTGASKALYVKGDTEVEGNINATKNITMGGDLTVGGFASWSGSIVATSKLFDIEHPTKGEGYRLAHACLEGPEHGIYCRGRLKNEKVIRLPYYWKDLVNIDTISVQLQPIGAHQDIIVKRWDEEFIYLQAQGGMPVNCFYHVYAARKDVNPLYVEYQGDSWKDYPDPNFNPEIKNPNYNDPNYRTKRNTVTI